MASAPYRFTWTNPGTGAWRVFARATDDRFGTGDSSPIAMTVTGPGMTTAVKMVGTLDVSSLNTLNLQIRITNIPPGFVASTTVPCGAASTNLVWQPTSFVSYSGGLILVCSSTGLSAVKSFTGLTFSVPLPVTAVIESINRDTGNVVGKAQPG
ncbi:MAG: hypothetical protein HQM09_13080 [Candidatus Riflebacteria bacterium]|nr:hypothetical protein [Candidatus Riflebacteria bacterium]